MEMGHAVLIIKAPKHWNNIKELKNTGKTNKLWWKEYIRKLLWQNWSNNNILYVIWIKVGSLTLLFVSLSSVLLLTSCHCSCFCCLLSRAVIQHVALCNLMSGFLSIVLCVFLCCSFVAAQETGILLSSLTWRKEQSASSCKPKSESLFLEQCSKRERIGCWIIYQLL